MAYIKKEPIVEFITKGLNNPDKDKAFGHDAIEILTQIEYAPTADVEEVVRCKDCIYYETHQPIHKKVCEKNEGHLIPMRPDDFCSYGERSDT